jgi:sialate O-acetylesterase
VTRTFLATITRTSILLAVLVGQVTSAEVKPNALFSDGAVLQQGMKVPMWGTASSGEMVSVTFQHQVVSTVARDGKWMVWLSPLRPGGPYTLKIAGENSIELTNIMVGEVWVCSGQSNMWFRLGAAANGREAAKASADPMLRLYTVPQAHAFERKGVFHAGSVSIRDLDVEGKWRQSGPDTVPKFSAVGYFFGRDLRKALKVPVGLINAAIGSSYVEEWIPRPVLEDVPELRQAIEASGYHETGGLYNDMIKPIIPYAIRGVIWYQGENNASEGSVWYGGSSGKMTNLRINERGTEKGAVAKGAYQYRSTFPIMIRNWREEWKEGNFPFLFVQLPPFYQHDPTSSSRPEISPAPQEGTWAELRESQLLSMMRVRRTAMVV